MLSCVRYVPALLLLLSTWLIRAPRAPAAMVVDNDTAGFEVLSGNWLRSAQGIPYGPDKRYIAIAASPTAQVRYTFSGLSPGAWHLEYWVNDNNYTSVARYTVETADGLRTVQASQNYVGDGWHSLGIFTLSTVARITLSNHADPPGVYVVADALRLSPAETAADGFEPDDTAPLARPIRLNETQSHSIVPIGDRDWCRFVLAAPRSVVMETSGTDGDTRLSLFDGALRLQATDDDGGTGTFSRLQVDDLPAGTYYVLVEENGSDSIISAYTLSVRSTQQGRISPYITLVIDDLGNEHPQSGATRDLLNLPGDFAFTPAVMPQRPYSTQVASALVAAGREFLLHQPMEPEGYPSVDPGPGAILLSTPNDQVARILSDNLAALGHAAGANNHMGSALTQNAAKMAIVCATLRQAGLLFFDSFTIASTVGFRTAQSTGIPTGVNARFLDGNGTADAVARITELANNALAQPNLAHIAIGHVRTGTVLALQQMVPVLHNLGVGTRTISYSAPIVIEVDAVPAGMAFVHSGNWQMTTGDTVFSLYAASRSETRDGSALRVVNCAASRIDDCTFTPHLPWTAAYDVYLAVPGDAANCSQVNVTLRTLHGIERLRWDQGEAPNSWYYLGRFDFLSGDQGWAMLDDYDATVPGETFYADAVKFVRAGPARPAVSPEGVSVYSLY